jgi:hypothetical protein
MKKSPFLVISYLLSCLLAACGTFEMGLETNQNTPTASILDTIQAYGTGNPILTPYPIAQPTPTPEPVEAYPSPGRLVPGKTSTPAYSSTTEASASWREYRDEPSGVGFALPCWWIIIGGGTSSESYSVTVSSFDEAYAWTNSLGEEVDKWPAGAMKIDFNFFMVENPSMSDEQAIRAALTSELNAVDSVQPEAIGPYAGWLAIQSRRDVPNSAGPVLALRLSPVRLLLIGVLPNSALSNPTIQAIFDSLALSADQPVKLPGVDPAPALIPTPFACAASSNP